MNDIVLTGFNGANPLCLLAALGATQALCEHSPGATLRWERRGAWFPILNGPIDRQGLVEILDESRKSWLGDTAFSLNYSNGKGGNLADIKAPPEIFRTWMAQINQQSDPRNRRSADLVASFASELIHEGDAVKPTKFHFLSGNQRFMTTIQDLVTNVNAEDFVEALYGPWKYQRTLMRMNWDAFDIWDAALLAGSSSDKGSVPAATWLGVTGLQFFPVVPDGSRLLTTGIERKEGSHILTWPMWTVPIGPSVIKSLLGRPNLAGLGIPEREALGVGAVFESKVFRALKYGRVTPGKEC